MCVLRGKLNDLFEQASIQFLNSRKAAVENALWPADLKDAVNTFLQDKRDSKLP